MLNSEKKIRALRDKKAYSNSRVVRKKNSELNIDAKLVWLSNNENIDILCHALCTFLKHI